jgi:hypothetical protein
MELGEPIFDANRNETSREPVRSKVEMQKLVTDGVVVVMKFL